MKVKKYCSLLLTLFLLSTHYSGIYGAEILEDAGRMLQHGGIEEAARAAADAARTGAEGLTGAVGADAAIAANGAGGAVSAADREALELGEVAALPETGKGVGARTPEQLRLKAEGLEERALKLEEKGDKAGAEELREQAKELKESATSVKVKSLRSAAEGLEERALKLEAKGDKAGAEELREQAKGLRAEANLEVFKGGGTKGLVFDSIKESGFYKSVAEDFAAFKKEGSATLWQFTKMAVGTVIAAVLFMLPNVVQATIENELQRKAELETITTPKKYGNWVVQMLADAINQNHPSMSIPLYVMIPAKTEKDSISDDTQKAFGKKISGPEESSIEKISRYVVDPGSMDNTTLKAGYLYNSDPSKHVGKLVMSYPAESYNHIGDSPISGPQFDGLLVDLNDGMIIRATGERYMPGDSTISPPLIPMKANAPQVMNQDVKSIKESLSHILQKLQTAGMVQTYKEYEGTHSGAGIDEDGNIKGSFQLLGNLLNHTSGVFLLDRALNKYKQAISFGVYTGLTPMSGWGKGYGDYADLIASVNTSKSVQEQAEESGAVLSFGKSGATPTVDTSTSFADPNTNYVAEGCWVYTCKDTPFATMLQKHVDSTYKDDCVDYVICLDKDHKQVPLMVSGYGLVPGQKALDVPTPGEWPYVWPTIILNPEVTHIASLISTSMEQFKINQGGTSYAVMYNGKGTPESTGNGGQEIEAAVQKALGDMQKDFPRLYDQFTVHSDAMVSRFLEGPFEYGHIELQKSTYSLQIKSSNIDLYEGTLAHPAYCYGEKGNVKDLLLPMAGGTTVVLPSDNVEEFVSLVTDIAYQVKIHKDGTKYLEANKVTDFAYAPGVWNMESFTPDNKKMSNYVYMSSIAKEAGDSNKVKDLEYYVDQQRKAWFAAMEGKSVSGGTEHGGFTYATPSQLTKDVLDRAECYIYSVTPSPSAGSVSKDWFIAVPSEAPSFATLQMVDMRPGTNKAKAGESARLRAAGKSQAKSLVSLVTGMVYDMQGNVRKTSAGKTVFFKAPATKEQESISEFLYEYFTSKAFEGVLSDNFSRVYDEAIKSYQGIANKIISQGSFGEVALGIYKGDLSSENYVYMNISGMSNAKDFEPKDMFITFDFDAKGAPVLGKALTDKTENLLSLVSGGVYKRDSGYSGSVDISIVKSYVDAHSLSWRHSLALQLTTLQNAHIKEQADRKAEEARERTILDRDVSSSKITLKESEALAMIRRLGKFLPMPYQTLKQDPQTGKFVHLSPANPNNPNEFIYLIFDVPNSYKDAAGKSIQVGGIYTEKGKLIQEMKGAVLEAMKHQFGLFGAAEKTLGVPVQQPSMLMARADKNNLQLGSDGDSMIVSTSDAFPGPKIKMPNGYFLYYNAVMNTYYVFDTKENRWMSVVGGNIYDRNGRPMPVKQSVAVNQAKDASADDMILLELNNAGYMQGTMMDQNAGGKFVRFVNRGRGEWTNENGAATVQEVKTAKGTDYKVHFGHNESKMYVVDSDYDWETLIYLPLTSSQILDNKTLPATLQRFKIVKEKGDVVYAIFNGVMYKTASTQGAAVTMKPVVVKTAGDISLNLQVDPNTNASYVKVTTARGNVYRYAYIYDQLDKDQQDTYKTTVLKGTVTACAASVPVRKEVAKPVKQADGSVQHEAHKIPDTHVLFVPNLNVATLQSVQLKDIIGAPTQASADYQTFANMLFRVKQDKGGRFVAQLFKDDGNDVHKPFIKYFNRDGYVDLQTGALFDNGGRALGVSLKIDDWFNVLNILNVSVNYNKQGVAALFFRNAATVDIQLQQQQQAQRVGIEYSQEDVADIDTKQSPSLSLRKESKKAGSNIAGLDTDNQDAGLAQSVRPRIRDRVNTQPVSPVTTSRKYVSPGRYVS